MLESSPIGADRGMYEKAWARSVLFLKLFWRGVRDLFDQFMILSLFSLLWWVCAILIVTGPPATVALAALADPRRMGAAPEVSDAIEIFRSSWKRSWGIALLTIPFLAMLIWNLAYFAGSNHTLAPMIPLWLVMIVLLFILTLYAFSVAGSMESGVRNAFRGAMYVLVSRPFMSIGLSLLMVILIFVMSITVLPMLLIGPALVASIVNRFTLTILGEEIIDPSSPTIERQDERSRGVNPDQTILTRLRRNSRSRNGQ
jgi:uncharacterized membrane protein YesL